MNAFEEEAELNSFESKIAGVLVTGIDSGAARSVVPAGEIPGYPRREGQRNWSCVHVCHWRARVPSGETADPGNCGRQSERLEHASRASQEESHERVRHMCPAGHRVVFDYDSNKRDLSHAENKLTGERTYFKFQNRAWELEVKIIPERGNRGHPDKDARVECRIVVSFRGAGTLAVSPIEEPRGFWTCSR